MTTNIITTLNDIDTQIFLALNSAHSEFLDPFMLFITNKWLWIPMSLILAFIIFRKSRAKKGLLCIAFIAIAVTISDQVCASWLRPAIERMRPSNLDNPISPLVHIVNDYRGGRFGFPSCHASTTIAIALFLSLYFRNKYATGILIGWSALLCYSRIYLGVHYPGDIICGLIIGSLSGYTCFKLYERACKLKYRPKFLKNFKTA